MLQYDTKTPTRAAELGFLIQVLTPLAEKGIIPAAEIKKLVDELIASVMKRGEE